MEKLPQEPTPEEAQKMAESLWKRLEAIVGPPKEPAPESVDLDIEKLLETLESYAELYNELSPGLQDQWYDVEIGAKAGKDRQAAKAHLEEFLKTLEKIKTEKK